MLYLNAINLKIKFKDLLTFYTLFKCFFFYYIKIPELKNTKVKIKNPNHVEYLLSNMINMGKEKLQVVSDFDRTITPVICPTSNGW